MNKIRLFLSVLFLCLVMPLYSQQASDSLVAYNELLHKYETLLTEHSTTLDDYDTLLTEYGTLLGKFDKLSVDYKDLTNNFIILTGQHELDIKFHESTKLSLLAANQTIENLEINVRQLLSIADTKYFAVYPQVGYAGELITAGVGLTAQLPKFPLSIMIDVDYINGLTIPINIQIGLGIRF